MKKISKLTVALLAILVFSGCEKALDIDDKGGYAPSKTWNSENLTNAYVADLYARIFGGWPVNSGNIADETMGIYGSDAILPTNDKFKNWPYENVFLINHMLENIDKGTLKDDVKNPFKGQAICMRAYCFFNALVYHGGIPYLTKVLYQNDPDIELPRDSSKDCFDKLIKDLDDAIALLPEKYTGNNYGRIDASFALALKAKVLLYKASPQFNPTKPYDNAYVDEAYQANKLAYETLKNRGYDLHPNYASLFTTDGNIEAVFAVVYNAPNKANARKNDECRPLSMSKNATGGDQAIWDLIEAYPMLDGKKINESTTYTYDLQTFWENRDPRLNATHVFNGSLYELGGLKGRRQYTAKDLCSPDDGFYLSANFGRSGIFPRKGMDLALSIPEVTTSSNDYTVMRFAEVMFNYAEIACAKGITSVGYDVIKAVRQRAGIEAGSDGMYGLKAGMSTTEMRQALLDEKRIEFCFEGQRFWDLRRNRQLDKLNGIRKYGILAEYNGTVTTDVIAAANNFELKPTDFKYTVQEIFGGEPKVMVIPDKYYFFPIKQSSIETNKNLKQNVDWGGDFNPVL